MGQTGDGTWESDWDVVLFSFLSSLDRIAEEGYIPSAQDILRTRVPTTGINEYCFSIQKVTLR